MSDLLVVSFQPEPGQYAWTFGGAAPVMRIRTPAVLQVFTEDCFAGRVHSEQDLVSGVCEFPFLNPQTGPFYIEGAEPVDLPMDPMHGTVGVAPANLEVRSALVPDAFGGNMDTPEMRAGVTCYLGVNVEGALLSLGDGHARLRDLADEYRH